MTSSDRFVIVGASLGGAKAAEALREKGFDGPIVLIGTDAHRPYERPPLSKQYLTGKAERDSVFVHPPQWYAEHDVDLRSQTTVTGIDPSAHKVTLADGDTIEYAKLLLTTGARPRALPVEGADADGVLYLRDLDDSDRLRAVVASAGRLVVVGAGWIGLEVTAAAREAGVAVSVVETLALPLLRVLGPEIAQNFADLHRAHGVDFYFERSVERILVSDGKASGVLLADGTELAADAVVVAVGVTPVVELATAAGLAVDNGVLVDASLRTSVPDIFAAGDVANELHPLLGTRVRVEHWANALKQPAAAAAAMLGEDVSYDELPYFFTDQYDLGMEYVGYVEPGGYDEVVVRGDLASREYVAFWLKDGRVLAGMNVNVWDVVDDVKQLIADQTVVDPIKLADPEIALTEVAT